MTDVRHERLSDRAELLGFDAEGFALFAPVPGERDLADDHYCDRSLERSRERRARVAARRPGLPPAAAARFSAALIAVGVVGAQGTDIAAAAPVSTTSGTLQLGDSGSAVRSLQRALGVSADGEFGPGTKRAVRSFQRKHGLEVDGVVGPATRRALGIGTASSSTSRKVSRVKSDAGGSTSTDAAFADVSASVARAVQAKLGVTADGEWGPASARALKAWQSGHGLEADGVPGPATLAAMGISASASSSSPSSSASSGDSASSGTSSGSSAIAAARAKIGSPYASGGNGPSSFDCSGLTVYAFRAAGISLPRTSFAQFSVGTSVSQGSVRAGDLVFFDTAGAGASHVGIATSSSTAISATSHGVMEHSFTSGYWAEHWVGARRV